MNNDLLSIIDLSQKLGPALLLIQDIAQIIAKSQLHAIWIDGKNLDSAFACKRLSRYLSDNRGLFPQTVLVEFPSASYLQGDELKECINSMLELNFHSSYYVPTDVLMRCAKELMDNKRVEIRLNCNALDSDLKLARLYGVFTDISFDYSGVDALKSIPSAQYFKWNAWHIRPEQVNAVDKNKYRLLMLSNLDPNRM